MESNFDVVIVGGSYAGLSAAMALGRSGRKTLVIDSGKPCNRQTPHSHNFLTHDGDTPAAIAQLSKEQVASYPSVNFLNGLVVAGEKTDSGFAITTEAGENMTAKKLLFTTGMRDIMPALPGFAECWGISVLHCPYCHGYEVKEEVLGVMANGDFGFEFTKVISNWTKKLTLFTNGKSTLTPEQTAKLQAKNVAIIDKEIVAIVHENGQMKHLLFADGSQSAMVAVYAKAPLEQHCKVQEQLGCQLSEQGFIEVTEFKKTSVAGIYAAGDNTTMFRSVAMAVGAGNFAGAMLNKELIDEEWA